MCFYLFGLLVITIFFVYWVHCIDGPCRLPLVTGVRLNGGCEHHCPLSAAALGAR